MNQPNDSAKPMVQNISCILPENSQLGGLFLGNVYGAQNPEILKEYGIRAIITASAETKINHSFDDIPFHLKIDAHDKDDYYIIEHANECIHFIQQNRKLTNVFVHCYAGVSRSSAIVASYLMWKYRWSVDKTLAFLTHKRIVAKPNDGFYNQLKEVEAKLGIASENAPAGNYPPVQQTAVQREKVMVKPNSPQMTEGQVTQTRPQSNKSFSGVAKPNSPPPPQQHLQTAQQPPQASQTRQYSQNPPRGSVPPEEAYYNPYQQPNPNRSIGGVQRIKAQQKQPTKNYQNHSEVPIPKVLARRSQSNHQNYQPHNPTSDYYQDPKIDKARKTVFNDYMSPEVMPTSPRHLPPTKNSVGKMNSSGGFGVTSKFTVNSGRDPYTERSIYSTSGNNDMMNTKKTFQSQEKTKTSSRCIIRPKDLPGYKNY